MAYYLDQYKPRSKKLYMGEEGRLKIMMPYITIHFYNYGELTIYDYDFAILALAYSFVIDSKGYDEYEGCSLNKKQVQTLFSEANKILEFDSFAEFYSYIRSYKQFDSVKILERFNSDIETLWKDRKDLKLMLEEIKSIANQAMTEEKAILDFFAY